MRQLLNPEMSIEFLNATTRILVFTAATGERIGVEADEVTAAKWAALITAPRNGEPCSS
jgi:hypothetical protein